ncbi:MAG: hypothetical protein ABJG47_15150 [Ekhidna sp.]
MNVSIISTYKEGKSSENKSRKISKVLLEIAETHLKSPETSHFISLDGVEKVRKKLAS